MKVIVVSSLAYSLINFRRTLLADMVKAGHEVIACAPENDAEVTDVLASIGVGFKSLPMKRASISPLSDLKTLAHLIGLLRAEAPDVVLAYTQKPIVYTGIAARIAGVPDFFAMVSGLGHVFSDSNHNRALRTVVAVLYRIGIQRARAVFVFNRDDREEMVRHGILRTDQTVVQVPGSGIDTKQFSAQPVPGGAPIFLLIARLLRDKGLVEFADAARQIRTKCPAARFQILGPMDTNPSGITIKELDNWKSEGAVEYLGETRDVTPFLAASTVFVLPTYYREGLPRTILEAMATGRAIITTDTPGCRETVRPGQNGFLIPVRDSGALVRAMMEFVEDPELSRHMGAKSREIAEQQFAVEIVNDLLLRTMRLRPPSEDREIATDAAARPSSALRRLMDVVVGFCGLICLTPVLLLIAACTFVSMGRPILFTQMRVGRNGRPFRLIKFRTMTNTRGPDGKLLDDTARTTWLGRLLRRTRLDELPELWNILAGDMSLIGPRPLLESSPLTLGSAGRLRSLVRPGLTGWAQVNGNTLLDDEQKLELDLWYIKNASLTVDLKILVRTIAVLFRGERINRLEVQSTREGDYRRFS